MGAAAALGGARPSCARVAVGSGRGVDGLNGARHSIAMDKPTQIGGILTCLSILAGALVALFPAGIEILLGIATLSAVGAAWFFILPIGGLAPAPQTPKAVADVPLSLRELFYTDFSECLGIENFVNVVRPGREGSLNIPCRLLTNLGARSKFLAVFVSYMETDDAIGICNYVARDATHIIEQLGKVVSFSSLGAGDTSEATSANVVFTRTIYVYHETNFSLQQLAALESEFHAQNLAVVFRGHSYHVLNWRDGRVRRMTPQQPVPTSVVPPLSSSDAPSQT